MLNNREILFRAWYDGKMVFEASRIRDALYWNKGLYFDACAFSNPDNMMLEYIGIKDKNDVEIYEGDIVDCNRHSTDEIYRVFVSDIRNIPMEMKGSNLNSLLIVGNVFENIDIAEEYGFINITTKIIQSL